MKISMNRQQTRLYLKDVECLWARTNTPTNKWGTKTKEWAITLLVDKAVKDYLLSAGINKEPKPVRAKHNIAMQDGSVSIYKPHQLDLYLLRVASPTQWPDGNTKDIPVTYHSRPYNQDIPDHSTVDVTVYMGALAYGKRLVYLESVHVRKLGELPIIGEQYPSTPQSMEVPATHDKPDKPSAPTPSHITYNYSSDEVPF